MDYRLDDDMSRAEAELVQRRLIEFADRFTGPRNYREFGVALRDASGEVVGGVTGNTIWNWLRIDVLWLREDLRGRGLGHQLLERAERIGRDRGCAFAMLDTFEFEARGFYEGNGYTVRSQTDDFPAGHTQFHLTKTLD